MTFKDKDIEQIFRDNQHGFDESPSPKVWSTLKERLHNHHLEKSKQLHIASPESDSLQSRKIPPKLAYNLGKNKSKKSNRIWLKYAAILLVMCIPLSIIFLYNLNNSNNLGISEKAMRQSGPKTMDVKEKKKRIGGWHTQNQTKVKSSDLTINSAKQSSKIFILEEEEGGVVTNSIKEVGSPDQIGDLVPVQSPDQADDLVPLKRFLDSRYYTISKEQLEDKSIYKPKKQKFTFDSSEKNKTISLKEDINWLLHSWKVEVDDVTLFEEWTMFDDNSFRGKALTFKDSKAIYGEDLILIKEGKSIFYHVLDQKTRTGITYQLQNSSNTQLVFQQVKAPKIDLQDSYPKTITYTLMKNNILNIYFGKIPYRNAFIYPTISLMLQ